MYINKIFIVNAILTTVYVLLFTPAFADSEILETIGKTSWSASSMAACVVVGTPVAIVRKTGNQYMDCVKEFKKDSNSYKFWGVLCSAPVAAIAGPIKGTICGAKNAIYHSVDKPFGKEAFSLSTLEDKKARAQTNFNSNPDKPETQPWGTQNTK